MKLGIIILHWKNRTVSLKLLNQILQWTLKDTILVLVQNESSQDDFPEISNKNLIKLYAAKNKGFGGGMNIGLRELNKYSIDYTLLLNPDVEIEKEAIEQLRAHLEHNPNTFAVGPKIIETSEGKTKNYIGGRNIAQFLNTRVEEVPPLLSKNLSVDYVIGAALLLNNHHLKKTGYFDEDFFFSGEVAELCYRAIKNGYRCETLLNIAAYHHLEEAPLRNTLYKYYNFRNRFIFMQKHPSQKKYLIKWYLILVKDVVYNLLKFNWQGLKTSLIIMYDVLFKVMGNRNHKF